MNYRLIHDIENAIIDRKNNVKCLNHECKSRNFLFFHNKPKEDLFIVCKRCGTVSKLEYLGED